MSARRHRRHGHRGAVGDHHRPQRAVAVRAPARARRGARADPDRRRPPRRHARGAGLPGRRGRRPGRHQRRPRADRRRPDRRGGGGFRGPPAGPRRGARGAHLGDPRAHAQPLAQPRRGRDPRGQPQAGARAGRRDGARAGRHRARAGRARGDARPCSCCQARRASCSRCGRPRWGPTPLRALLGARAVRAADHAAVRDPRVRDRALAARDRGRGAAARALEITTCLRRGEIEIATVFEPAAVAGLRRFEAAMRARHARHAVLAGRLDDRRPGRLAARPAAPSRWPSRARAG